MIDINAARLDVTSRLGATAGINVTSENAVAVVKRLTDGVSVDCAIEPGG